MNRRTSGSMTLSRATEGFLQYKAAEGLSPNTLQGYQRDLKLWLEYAGDVAVSKITTHQIQAYLVWLRTDYKPRPITDNQHALASKRIHNFYISLCAFFTWACREFDLPNPIKTMPAPKFEQTPVKPFTKDEVELLLKACEFSVEVRPSDGHCLSVRLERSTAAIGKVPKAPARMPDRNNSAARHFTLSDIHCTYS